MKRKLMRRIERHLLQTRTAPTTFGMEELRTRPWASASFRGARHELAFRLEGAAADEAANRFLAGLETDIPKLAGQIVASVSVLADERRPGCARIRIEAVTVDAA
jgi:hypothetical protein